LNVDTNLVQDFYCAMHYSEKGGLATLCRLSVPTVRLSVCPSVTLVDHDHIASWSSWINKDRLPVDHTFVNWSGSRSGS